MYRLDRSEFIQSRFIGLWALLGFQAGFINSFGFLACGRYVSHVTGFGTQVGLALGVSDFLFALEMFSIPVSFVFGSFLSGLLTVVRIDRNQVPHYDWISMVLPLLFFGFTFMGYNGYFGAFEQSELGFMHFILLASLSMACGIQNGCFATMTKGQIRTTHLTGIATDIGTDLSRILFANLDKTERRAVRRVNFSRLATFFAFGFGAAISIWTTGKWHYLALLVPATTSCVVAIVVHIMKRKMNQSYVENLSTLVTN